MSVRDPLSTANLSRMRQNVTSIDGSKQNGTLVNSLNVIYTNTTLGTRDVETTQIFNVNGAERRELIYYQERLPPRPIGDCLVNCLTLPGCAECTPFPSFQIVRASGQP